MASKERPLLRLRLRGGKYEEGEIPLYDLSQIARETQLVVRRLGDALVARRGPGRPPAAIEQATELLLVGLTKGSTVLEIAAADAPSLAFEDMPPDLRERALTLFIDSVTALGEEHPDMPLGFNEAARKGVDHWLRSVRRFEHVGVSLRMGAVSKADQVDTATARNRLKRAQIQPSVPFVTASQQAVEGELYALNVRTGTYQIEDDSGQKIRLIVPSEIRSDAAILVTRRVRAIGTAEVDERGRLQSFSVSTLRKVPASDVLEQGRFFQHHELNPPAAVGDDLDRWAIQGLSDEEADDFLASLSE